ncbi:MAG TPA: magnesium transporter CorA family protein [Dehalococcoidales bacterium]|nr:magnesium transporter CorA family protein [Dehalococcoidales bacterium]
MARITGRKREIKEEEVQEEPLHIESITWGDLTWVNIQPPTQREIEYLAKNYPFHPLDLDDCLSRKQIPKVDEYPEYLFAIFHIPVFDKVTRVSTKRQWSAFLGDNFLVTLHTGELRTLTALFRDCQANEESRKEYFSNGSGYLLYRILDRSIDSYFPVLDKILSLMEDMEDNVFDEDIETAKELSILRRDIIAQRRVMFPTRTLFMSLERRLKRFTKVDITVYFGDLVDHMNKICETLDELKEVIEVFKDTDYTLATYRINRVTRLVTIFSTIVLPFLIVSSLYGMNVRLPGGLETGDIQTFLILLLVMLMIAAGMLFFFRRRRWI